MKPNIKSRPDNTSNRSPGMPSTFPNEPQAVVEPRRPSFTIEEAIVLRALTGGKTDKQVCTELRMPSSSFHRLLRDLCEKAGVADHLSLLVWALRQMKSGESRTGRRDGYPRVA
jgi:DNA-binding NarL/FixJ family response regulator